MNLIILFLPLLVSAIDIRDLELVCKEIWVLFENKKCHRLKSYGEFCVFDSDCGFGLKCVNNKTQCLCPKGNYFDWNKNECISNELSGNNDFMILIWICIPAAILCIYFALAHCSFNL